MKEALSAHGLAPGPSMLDPGLFQHDRGGWCGGQSWGGDRAQVWGVRAGEGTEPGGGDRAQVWGGQGPGEGAEPGQGRWGADGVHPPGSTPGGGQGQSHGQNPQRTQGQGARFCLGRPPVPAEPPGGLKTASGEQPALANWTAQAGVTHGTLPATVTLTSRVTGPQRSFPVCSQAGFCGPGSQLP
jgi:hypothetical protein